MIEFSEFSFRYDGAAQPVLRDVSFTIDEGEFALVSGLTGSGKSTLLRAVNGLVPHFSGGHVEGSVVAGGLDTRDAAPRDFAATVGFVGQDPAAGFVTDTVEEELAYGMEQLAVEPQVMRRRVEEVLDLMSIAHLRRRALRTLSGGEQQRVALGSVLTAGPRVLVLDEPTSALDPAAAEDALAAVLRLVHDLGVTVLAAEHRLERVVEYADRLVVVSDGRVRVGAPADLLVDAPIAPPVVELGRWAGWSPLPLSVRDARRAAGPLRDQLANLATGHKRRADRSQTLRRVVTNAAASGLAVHGLSVRYGDAVAVRTVEFAAAPGEVVALMGRNGSGKSSLLWAAQGAGRRDAGTVAVDGVDPVSMSRVDRARAITLVPQQATDLLFHDSVAAECKAADQASGVADGASLALLGELLDESIEATRHPRDLSDGQRLALVLAVQLVSRPAVLLLDEPTRGLDYRAKERLHKILASLADSDHAVVVATHDVEFVARLADRVVVMAEGDVITSAPTAEALAASPVFAPQVAKVLAPQPWLTVEDVVRAVEGSGDA